MPDDPNTTTAHHSGFHHVTLNVRDIEESAVWYHDVLGFVRLTDYETADFVRVVLRHPGSGAILGLNRHHVELASEPFDERRAGLDHLALTVSDPTGLNAWIKHLDALGVPHSDVKPGAIPGSALVTFRDPDGIQLEVFAPVARA